MATLAVKKVFVFCAVARDTVVEHRVFYAQDRETVLGYLLDHIDLLLLENYIGFKYDVIRYVHRKFNTDATGKYSYLGIPVPTEEIKQLTVELKSQPRSILTIEDIDMIIKETLADGDNCSAYSLEEATDVVNL